MSTQMNWVSSDGGPLILAEKNLASAWGGILSASIEQLDSRGQGQTDYERACAVDDYLGIVRVGSGEALVLGDEPMQTSWLALTATQSVLVRWQWANDEDSVIKAVGELAEELWEPTGLTFLVRGHFLLLFDAACSGKELVSSLEIELSPGKYSIDTAFCQPRKEVSLILHRLSC